MSDKITEVFNRVRHRITTAGYKKKMRDAGYNDAGEFIPDGTPMAPPVGYKPQPSMVEVIRDMVRNERLQADLDAAGLETFEEADDFEVGDDGEDLKSGFENDFDPPIAEVLKAGREEIARRRAAEAQGKPAEGVKAPE